MRRHPLSGYPLEHEHVITVEHQGEATIGRCQCGSFCGSRLRVVQAWIAQHRRRHLPRFAA